MTVTLVVYLLKTNCTSRIGYNSLIANFKTCNNAKT